VGPQKEKSKKEAKALFKRNLMNKTQAGQFAMKAKKRWGWIYLRTKTEQEKRRNEGKNPQAKNGTADKVVKVRLRGKVKTNRLVGIKKGP